VDLFDAAGVIRVELPEEPADLKEKLCRLTAEPGGPDTHEACLGLWLWERWQPALEPVGYTRDQFVDEVVRARREQLLWIRGERQWDHFVTGLAGRLLRRAPAGAAAVLARDGGQAPPG
jgi:hypothetical protein